MNVDIQLSPGRTKIDTSVRSTIIKKQLTDIHKWYDYGNNTCQDDCEDE